MHWLLCKDDVFVGVVDLAKKSFDGGFGIVGIFHLVLVVLNVDGRELSVFDEEVIEDLPEVGCCAADQVMIKILVEGWLDGGEK